MTEPVTEWENDIVGGKALCHKFKLDSEMKHIGELRERQAAYLAELPTDPTECIDKALGILNPGSEEYPEGFDRARHMAVALTALVRHGDLSNDLMDHAAASYIAQTIADDLEHLRTDLDRVNDLIRSPRRVSSEYQFEA